MLDKASLLGRKSKQLSVRKAGVGVEAWPERLILLGCHLWAGTICRRRVYVQMAALEEERDEIGPGTW